MNKRLAQPLVLMALLLLTSCSPKLVGTWRVQKYETIIPGQQNVSVSNIGSITFKKNNKGVKDIHYTVLGRQYDDSGAFTWTGNDGYVTIQANDSTFSKTWFIKENSRKTQRWQSAERNGEIQTLELKR